MNLRDIRTLTIHVLCVGSAHHTHTTIAVHSTQDSNINLSSGDGFFQHKETMIGDGNYPLPYVTIFI